MHRLPFLLLLLFAAGLFAACDSSDPGGDGGPGSITGTWSGEVTSGGTPLTVEVELTEVQTQVSGQGFVDTPQGRAPFTIVTDLSNYLHPLLSLRMLYDVSPTLTLPGSLNANVSEDRNELRGTMDGPSFMGIVELTLRRVNAP